MTINRDKLIEMQINKAIEIGSNLAKLGLVEGTSGNLSFKINDSIVITKTGENLAKLTKNSFLVIKVDEESEEATRDLLIHKEIYKKTKYNAVLHCHGVYNVILSFLSDIIEPMDLEGKMHLKKVKVIEGEFGSRTLAEKIAEEILKNKIVVVRGHGIYSAENTLDKAFELACYLERSSKIIYLYHLLKLLN